MDKALVEKAKEFAKKAHEGQKRASGEPYFNHLEGTVKHLRELQMSDATIAAGYLHDILEDVGTKPEEIEKEFGKEIRFIVEGVTKLGHLKYHGADRHNESLRKLFVAMSQDIRVLIVKLCDRLHNMETLKFVAKQKQERIAKETLEIYAPIAYRLGIRKLSKQLEDLAFPYIYPKEFKEITNEFKKRRDSESDALDKFRKNIAKALAKNGIKDFKIDYRIKGLYSLYKKYLRKNRDMENIYDIAAVRVLLKNQEDCYKVLGMIHAEWQPLPGKIKDYISFPKENGYQGLHTTVFTGEGTVAEVQIKTETMQKEAEYGIASHISYKQDSKNKKLDQGLLWIKNILPSFIKNNLSSAIDSKSRNVPKWIEELVEYQNINQNEENAFDEIKNDFLNQRIFVFTPKGDVVDLPIGSSVVDFAYSIHSDIGDHMSGAKINGKMSSIESTLKSGDIVEIITKKSSRPSSKWLAHTKTTFAKKHIRQLN